MKNMAPDEERELEALRTLMAIIYGRHAQDVRRRIEGPLAELRDPRPPAFAADGSPAWGPRPEGAKPC